MLSERDGAEMIVAEQKPLEEIRKLIAPYDRVLLLGCGTCVTVCFAGGEKEVGVLAAALRMAERIDGRDVMVSELTIHRQCEPEFVGEVRDKLGDAQAVLSLGCGVGVQAVAAALPGVRVLPGLNTKFMGETVEPGFWREACLGCGNCVLDLTGGICPIARCSKSLLNGPCGGSEGGRCEISKDVECAWQLIYDRLSQLGRLDLMEEIIPFKDWSTAHAGGPRKIVRPDLAKLT